jgi:hypothetical protein
VAFTSSPQQAGGRKADLAVRPIALSVASLLFVTLPPLAGATEGGGSVYPYGLNTVASGVLPKPGSYLYMYNSYYTADSLMNDDGDGAPVPFEVDVRVHTLRFQHVFASKPILGGTPGLLVAQPFLIGDASIGARQDYRSDLGDLTVGIMLGWHAPRWHQMTGVDFTLPTGDYSTRQLFNAGRNQYAATFYYAVTRSLGDHVDANLRANLTVSQENPDTDYQSGLDGGLEYSLNYRLPEGWLVGLNGYLQHQLTDDEIDGAPVNGHGQKAHAFAYGPVVGYRAARWGASTKWQHETQARNKAEGEKYWLQLFYAF